MKVTLERSNLVAALSNIHRVVQKKNTIPVLANVLIEASKVGIKLRATDLDLEMSNFADAEVSVKGSTTVPAHLFYDIARKLPEGSQIALEEKNGSLTVKAGRSRFTLQTLSADDFPDLAAGEMPWKFSLGAGAVKELFGRTQFAISTEETRYYLNGIYLHLVEGGDGPMLRAVATDGHRLAQCEIIAPDGSAGMPGVIVPRKTVAEVLRLADAGGEIHIEVSAAKIRVTVGGNVLTSKLIDGTFPDYGRVVPKGYNNIAVLDAAEIKAAVERVSAVRSATSGGVALDFKDGKLKLTHKSDTASSEEELEVEYDAVPVIIGFNSRYLLDIMSQIEGEKIRVELGDAGSPALIRSEEAESFLSVLMPMRV